MPIVGTRRTSAWQRSAPGNVSRHSRRWNRAGGGKRLNDYRRLLADGLRGDWQLDEVSREIAADRNIPRSILWNHIVSLVLFHEYISDDFEAVEKEYLAFCRQIVADLH
jgi:hypothetical protein